MSALSRAPSRAHTSRALNHVLYHVLTHFKAKQWMLVDSLIVRPYYEQFPIFDVETVTKAEEFKLNFQNEQCLLKELDAANGLTKLRLGSKMVG